MRVKWEAVEGSVHLWEEGQCNLYICRGDRWVECMWGRVECPVLLVGGGR